MTDAVRLAVAQQLLEQAGPFAESAGSSEAERQLAPQAMNALIDAGTARLRAGGHTGRRAGHRGGRAAVRGARGVRQRRGLAIRTTRQQQWVIVPVRRRWTRSGPTARSTGAGSTVMSFSLHVDSMTVSSR